MNRKQLLEFIRREICPKLHIKQELDIATTIKVLEHFRTDNHIKVNEPMTATINEYGHLFINGIHAGQISNKIPYPEFDEQSYYIESLILARQEL